MDDMYDDNRFELIEKYKKELIEATNIETAPDEMTVLDDILFRFWQMGWLDSIDRMLLVKESAKTLMHSVGDSVSAKAFRNAGRFIQNAIDGEAPEFEMIPSAQPEQQHGRIFQEIVVEYPSISVYPEYEGKPYFSIKYTENGQGFIGYGTYKPEVLSEYLKEYFMSPAQPEIIRCKYCTHSEHWYKDKRRCFLWHEEGIDVFEDGYCNYAKRRMRGKQDGNT